MKSVLKVLVGLVVAVMLVFPAAIGCAPTETPPQPPEEQPQVEKWDEIVFPCVQDLTGPWSALSLPGVAGLNDFCGWLNSNGGIDGVPLVPEWYDTRGDPAAAVSAYAKIRELQPSPITMFVGLSQAVAAYGSRLAEDKIPVVATMLAEQSMWPPSWAFCITASYPDSTAAFIDWLSVEWEKSGETRKCRLAFFNPDYTGGRAVATPEVFEYIKTKPNIEVVANEFYDMKALDLSSDIIRLMKNDPDWIFGFIHATSGAAFYKSLDATGYRGKVRIGASTWSMQSENALLSGDLIEGVVGPFFVPPFLPEGEKQISESMEFVAGVFNKADNPPEYRSSAYVIGFLYPYWVVGTIEKAIAEVGWDKLDGTAVYNAYKNTREMDLGGIGTWGAAPGTRTNNKVEMLEFKNGIPMPITDWITCPDLRPEEFRTDEYSWTGYGWPEGYFK